MKREQSEKLREIFNLSQSTLSYSDAKKISREIDLKLGFQCVEVETLISQREKTGGKDFESWNNLSPQAFQTPYSELEELVKLLNPAQEMKTWVDLGAAYGRLGFVLALYAPLSKHIGYEIAPERANEGMRVARLHGLERTEIRVQDLSARDFKPESADIYFIYDYGRIEAIRKTLEDLREIASIRPIQVVARGIGIQNEIDRHTSWLRISPPRRLAHSTVYQS